MLNHEIGLAYTFPVPPHSTIAATEPGRGLSPLTPFAKVCRRLRDARNLPLGEFAHAIGLHPSHLSGIERGRNGLTLRHVVDIVALLEPTDAERVELLQAAFETVSERVAA